jgi:hypothetical protein
MRLLNFNVEAQHISKDPNCDFTKIVAGTSNYLKAHFTFSPEWQGCKKAASFWRGGQEHAVILKDDECDIPEEVLTGMTFGVTVTGQNGDYRITTNRVTVRQEVSR